MTVKPYSILTASTIDLTPAEYHKADASERTILELPYTDDYEYADYPADYLSSRGSAPRYTTDEGGAFEVENGMLVQQITPDLKAKEWGWTPDPTTNFGDDRWYNYSVSANVTYAPSENKESNYAGVGLRYTQGNAGASGYWLKLTEGGSWSLWENSDVLKSGTISADTSAPVALKIEAVGRTVRCWANDEQLCEYTAEGPVLGAGRAAFYSSYDRNGFDDLVIAPAEGGSAYITRVDNTDLAFSYAGEWEHNTMSSFKNYKRTLSTGKEGSSFTVDFNGTGIALTGGGSGATISWSVDGGDAQEYTFGKNSVRKANFLLDGLADGAHTLSVTVVDGKYNIDGAEITGGTVYTAKQIDHSASVQPASGESSQTREAAATQEQSAADGASDMDSDSKSGFPAGAAVGIGAAVVAAAGIGIGIGVSRKKKKQ